MQMVIDAKASRAYLEACAARERQASEERRQAALAALHAGIGPVLARYPQVRRAYLFGSAIDPGAFLPGSDLDIAVDVALDAETYFAIWRDLESAVPGYEFDVIELDRADVHFADRVRETGELIYEAGDPNAES
jgi:predicted nucleotidyltransferase